MVAVALPEDIVTYLYFMRFILRFIFSASDSYPVVTRTRSGKIRVSIFGG